MKRALLGSLIAVTVSRVTSVSADAPTHWPFTFDPAIAADPTGTGQKITAGNATYPLMPLDRMVPLQSDAVTLYYWPETAAMLERLRTTATNPPMAWPLTTTMCTAHAGFMLPTLLVGTPTAACQASFAKIQQDMTDLGACQDVEFSELYALGYDPTNARATTDNIVDMIGQAGEAWAHAPAPQVGLLPDDWVPTLRVVLDKLRYDALTQHATTATTAYNDALTELSANAACFDPGAAATTTTAIHALASELAAAQGYINNLKSSGEASNAQENVCLAAQARVRGTVSYPSLTRAEREFVAFWLGGTYWRMRGGGLIPLGATQDARWYFVDQAWTQIGQMLGGQDGIDVAFQIYYPLLLIGWSDWQDMGNSLPGADKYDDLVSMTKRGEQQVDGAVNLLNQRNYHTLDLTVGGLEMGPGYYRGYYPMNGLTYAQEMEPQPPYSDGISGPTAIGEFSFGASMSLGLAHVLLDGHDTGQAAVPLCQNAVCGDDGCGGSCGTCNEGMMCSAGQCLVLPPPDGGVPFDSNMPDGSSGNPETGNAGAGCCEAGGGQPFGAAALVGLVGLCWRRQRRQRTS